MIVITGWGKEAGPAYNVVTSRLNKKKHRRERFVEVVRKQAGKSYKGADWRVVQTSSGESWLLLNGGHHYTVRMLALGSEIAGGVDATSGSKAIRVDDDTEVLSVSSDGSADSGD